MALLLNLHFLVTVAIVFGLYKLNSRVLLSHRLVDGLRMWLPPSDEAVAGSRRVRCALARDALTATRSSLLVQRSRRRTASASAAP
jgi:hypothetical protein